MDILDRQNIDKLSDAIRDLSRQVNALQQSGYEEPEILKKYKDEGTMLEFTLVTGGLIRGRILWSDSQSFGIRNDSDQNVILYKQAIAFIQESPI